MILLFANGFAFSAPVFAGDLAKARSAVRSEKKDSKPKKKKRRRSHNDCDDDDDGSFLGAVLGIFFSSDSDSNSNSVGFTSYASTESSSVHASYETTSSSNDITYQLPRLNSMIPEGATRLNFDYGTDFDDIDRFTGGLLLDGPGGWAIDFEWSHYREKLVAQPDDGLNLIDTNILYRIGETEQFQWRVGGGLTLLSDSFGTDAGWNVTNKTDWYLTDPLSISTQLDVGTIGNASHVHAAIMSGYNVGFVEFRVGYDFRKIGDVDLSGPSFSIILNSYSPY